MLKFCSRSQTLEAAMVVRIWAKYKHCLQYKFTSSAHNHESWFFENWLLQIRLHGSSVTLLQTHNSVTLQWEINLFSSEFSNKSEWPPDLQLLQPTMTLILCVNFCHLKQLQHLKKKCFKGLAKCHIMDYDLALLSASHSSSDWMKFVLPHSFVHISFDSQNTVQRLLLAQRSVNPYLFHPSVWSPKKEIIIWEYKHTHPLQWVWTICLLFTLLVITAQSTK